MDTGKDLKEENASIILADLIKTTRGGIKYLDIPKEVWNDGDDENNRRNILYPAKITLNMKNYEGKDREEDTVYKDSVLFVKGVPNGYLFEEGENTFEVNRKLQLDASFEDKYESEIELYSLSITNPSASEQEKEKRRHKDKRFSILEVTPSDPYVRIQAWDTERGAGQNAGYNTTNTVKTSMDAEHTFYEVLLRNQSIGAVNKAEVVFDIPLSVTPEEISQTKELTIEGYAMDSIGSYHPENGAVSNFIPYITSDVKVKTVDSNGEPVIITKKRIDLQRIEIRDFRAKDIKQFDENGKITDEYKEAVENGLIVVYEETTGLLDHQDTKKDLTEEDIEITLADFIKTADGGIKYLDIPKAAWNDGNDENNSRNVLYPAKVIVDSKKYEGKAKEEDDKTSREAALFVKGIPNGYLFKSEENKFEVNRKLQLDVSFEDKYESSINLYRLSIVEPSATEQKKESSRHKKSSFAILELMPSDPYVHVQAWDTERGTGQNVGYNTANTVKTSMDAEHTFYEVRLRNRSIGAVHKAEVVLDIPLTETPEEISQKKELTIKGYAVDSIGSYHPESGAVSNFIPYITSDVKVNTLDSTGQPVTVTKKRIDLQRIEIRDFRAKDIKQFDENGKVTDEYKEAVENGLIVVYEDTAGLLDHRDTKKDLTKEDIEITLADFVKTTDGGIKYLDVPKAAWNDGNDENNSRNVLYPAKIIVDAKKYKGKTKTEDAETSRDSTLFVKGIPNGYLFKTEENKFEVDRKLQLNASFEDRYESGINLYKLSIMEPSATEQKKEDNRHKQSGYGILELMPSDPYTFVKAWDTERGSYQQAGYNTSNTVKTSIDAEHTFYEVLLKNHSIGRVADAEVVVDMPLTETPEVKDIYGRVAIEQGTIQGYDLDSIGSYHPESGAVSNFIPYITSDEKITATDSNGQPMTVTKKLINLQRVEIRDFRAKDIKQFNENGEVTEEYRAALEQGLIVVYDDMEGLLDHKDTNKDLSDEGVKIVLADLVKTTDGGVKYLDIPEAAWNDGNEKNKDRNILYPAKVTINMKNYHGKQKTTDSDDLRNAALFVKGIPDGCLFEPNGGKLEINRKLTLNASFEDRYESRIALHELSINKPNATEAEKEGKRHRKAGSAILELVPSDPKVMAQAWDTARGSGQNSGYDSELKVETGLDATKTFYEVYLRNQSIGKVAGGEVVIDVPLSTTPELKDQGGRILAPAGTIQGYDVDLIQSMNPNTSSVSNFIPYITSEVLVEETDENGNKTVAKKKQINLQKIEIRDFRVKDIPQFDENGKVTQEYKNALNQGLIVVIDDAQGLIDHKDTDIDFSQKGIEIKLADLIKTNAAGTKYLKIPEAVWNDCRYADSVRNVIYPAKITINFKNYEGKKTLDDAISMKDSAIYVKGVPNGYLYDKVGDFYRKANRDLKLNAAFEDTYETNLNLYTLYLDTAAPTKEQIEDARLRDFGWATLRILPAKPYMLMEGHNNVDNYNYVQNSKVYIGKDNDYRSTIGNDSPSRVDGGELVFDLPLDTVPDEVTATGFKLGQMVSDPEFVKQISHYVLVPVLDENGNYRFDEDGNLLYEAKNLIDIQSIDIYDYRAEEMAQSYSLWSKEYAKGWDSANKKILKYDTDGNVTELFKMLERLGMIVSYTDTEGLLDFTYEKTFDQLIQEQREAYVNSLSGLSEEDKLYAADQFADADAEFMLKDFIQKNDKDELILEIPDAAWGRGISRQKVATSSNAYYDDTDLEGIRDRKKYVDNVGKIVVEVGHYNENTYYNTNLTPGATARYSNRSMMYFQGNPNGFLYEYEHDGEQWNTKHKESLPADGAMRDTAELARVTGPWASPLDILDLSYLKKNSTGVMELARSGPSNPTVFGLAIKDNSKRPEHDPERVYDGAKTTLTISNDHKQGLSYQYRLGNTSDSIMSRPTFTVTLPINSSVERDNATGTVVEANRGFHLNTIRIDKKLYYSPNMFYGTRVLGEEDRNYDNLTEIREIRLYDKNNKYGKDSKKEGKPLEYTITQQDIMAAMLAYHNEKYGISTASNALPGQPSIGTEAMTNSERKQHGSIYVDDNGDLMIPRTAWYKQQKTDLEGKPVDDICWIDEDGYLYMENKDKYGENDGSYRKLGYKIDQREYKSEWDYVYEDADKTLIVTEENAVIRELFASPSDADETTSLKKVQYYASPDSEQVAEVETVVIEFNSFDARITGDKGGILQFYGKADRYADDITRQDYWNVSNINNKMTAPAEFVDHPAGIPETDLNRDSCAPTFIIKEARPVVHADLRYYDREIYSKDHSGTWANTFIGNALPPINRNEKWTVIPYGREFQVIYRMTNDSISSSENFHFEFVPQITPMTKTGTLEKIVNAVTGSEPDTTEESRGFHTMDIILRKELLDLANFERVVVYDKDEPERYIIIRHAHNDIGEDQYPEATSSDATPSNGENGRPAIDFGMLDDDDGFLVPLPEPGRWVVEYHDKKKEESNETKEADVTEEDLKISTLSPVTKEEAKTYEKTNPYSVAEGIYELREGDVVIPRDVIVKCGKIQNVGRVTIEGSSFKPMRNPDFDLNKRDEAGSIGSLPSVEGESDVDPNQAVIFVGISDTNLEYADARSITSTWGSFRNFLYGRDYNDVYETPDIIEPETEIAKDKDEKRLEREDNDTTHIFTPKLFFDSKISAVLKDEKDPSLRFDNETISTVWNTPRLMRDDLQYQHPACLAREFGKDARYDEAVARNNYGYKYTGSDFSVDIAGTGYHGSGGKTDRLSASISGTSGTNTGYRRYDHYYQDNNELSVGYKAIASYTVDFQQWAQTSWDTSGSNYATPIPYQSLISGSGNSAANDVSRIDYLRNKHTDNIAVQPQDLSAAADITMKIDLPADGFDAYYVKLRPALRPFVNSVTVEYVTYEGGVAFDDLVINARDTQNTGESTGGWRGNAANANASEDLKAEYTFHNGFTPDVFDAEGRKIQTGDNKIMNRSGNLVDYNTMMKSSESYLTEDMSKDGNGTMWWRISLADTNRYNCKDDVDISTMSDALPGEDYNPQQTEFGYDNATPYYRPPSINVTKGDIKSVTIHMSINQDPAAFNSSKEWQRLLADEGTWYEEWVDSQASRDDLDATWWKAMGQNSYEAADYDKIHTGKIDLNAKVKQDTRHSIEITGRMIKLGQQIANLTTSIELGKQFDKRDEKDILKSDRDALVGKQMVDPENRVSMPRKDIGVKAGDVMADGFKASEEQEHLQSNWSYRRYYNYFTHSVSEYSRNFWSDGVVGRCCHSELRHGFYAQYYSCVSYQHWDEWHSRYLRDRAIINVKNADNLLDVGIGDGNGYLRDEDGEPVRDNKGALVIDNNSLDNAWYDSSAWNRSYTNTYSGLKLMANYNDLLPYTLKIGQVAQPSSIEKRHSYHPGWESHWYGGTIAEHLGIYDTCGHSHYNSSSDSYYSCSNTSYWFLYIREYSPALEMRMYDEWSGKYSHMDRVEIVDKLPSITREDGWYKGFFTRYLEVAPSMIPYVESITVELESMDENGKVSTRTVKVPRAAIYGNTQAHSMEAGNNPRMRSNFAFYSAAAPGEGIEVDENGRPVIMPTVSETYNKAGAGKVFFHYDNMAEDLSELTATASNAKLAGDDIDEVMANDPFNDSIVAATNVIEVKKNEYPVKVTFTAVNIPGNGDNASEFNGVQREDNGAAPDFYIWGNIDDIITDEIGPEDSIWKRYDSNRNLSSPWSYDQIQQERSNDIMDLLDGLYSGPSRVNRVEAKFYKTSYNKMISKTLPDPEEFTRRNFWGFDDSSKDPSYQAGAPIVKEGRSYWWAKSVQPSALVNVDTMDDPEQKRAYDFEGDNKTPMGLRYRIWAQNTTKKQPKYLQDQDGSIKTDEEGNPIPNPEYENTVFYKEMNYSGDFPDGYRLEKIWIPAQFIDKDVYDDYSFEADRLELTLGKLEKIQDGDGTSVGNKREYKIVPDPTNKVDLLKVKEGNEERTGVDRFEYGKYMHLVPTMAEANVAKEQDGGEMMRFAEEDDVYAHKYYVIDLEKMFFDGVLTPVEMPYTQPESGEEFIYLQNYAASYRYHVQVKSKWLVDYEKNKTRYFQPDSTLTGKLSFDENGKEITPKEELPIDLMMEGVFVDKRKDEKYRKATDSNAQMEETWENRMPWTSTYNSLPSIDTDQFTLKKEKAIKTNVSLTVTAAGINPLNLTYTKNPQQQASGEGSEYRTKELTVGDSGVLDFYNRQMGLPA